SIHLPEQLNISTDSEPHQKQKEWEKALKKGIPRRHKPVVQRQSHHAQVVQAEDEGLGRQKLDNQEWRRCLHNSG
ncbi:hypothetical protein P691DRAFT_671968, partial [Macrolepiota fuliginosa MF-IS2]